MADDLADYIADNYGQCALDAHCRCLREGWLGCMCPNWTPCGAKDLRELRQKMVEFHWHDRSGGALS